MAHKRPNNFFETLGAVLRTLGVRLGFLEPTVFVKTTQTSKHKPPQLYNHTNRQSKIQKHQYHNANYYISTNTTQLDKHKIQKYKTTNTTKLQTPKPQKHKQKYCNTHLFSKGGRVD